MIPPHPASLLYDSPSLSESRERPRPRRDRSLQKATKRVRETTTKERPQSDDHGGIASVDIQQAKTAAAGVSARALAAKRYLLELRNEYEVIHRASRRRRSSSNDMLFLSSRSALALRKINTCLGVLSGLPKIPLELIIDNSPASSLRRDGQMDPQEVRRTVSSHSRRRSS